MNTLVLPSRGKMQAFLVEQYAPAVREHRGVGTYGQVLSYYEAYYKAETVTDAAKKEVERIKDPIEKKVDESRKN